MKPKEAQKIIDCIKGLVDTTQVDATLPPAPAKPPGNNPLVSGSKPGDPAAMLSADYEEQLYQRFKNRILDDARIDPILLHILTTRPEILVEVEPRTVRIDAAGLKGRIARLAAQGFFSEPRRQQAVRTALMRTGGEPNSGNLSNAMSDFVTEGFLVRNGDDYTLAPGVKATERELSTRA